MIEFQDFDDMMSGEFRKARNTGLAFIVIALVLNLAFWGALIWFVFFLLGHFGVIG